MAQPGTGTAAPHIQDYDIQGDTLIKYHGQSPAPTVPQGVRVIGEGAFSRQMITSVTLPDSVEVIGPRAFQLCMKLGSVRMSRGVERIEERAFEHCRSLLVLSLPESLRFIGERAFAGSGLSGIIDFPASVAHIGDQAYQYCPWLSGAIFYGSPRDIGRLVFDQCALFTRPRAAAELLLRMEEQDCFSSGTAASEPGADTCG